MFTSKYIIDTYYLFRLLKEWLVRSHGYPVYVHHHAPPQANFIISEQADLSKILGNDSEVIFIQAPTGCQMSKLVCSLLAIIIYNTKIQAPILTLGAFASEKMRGCGRFLHLTPNCIQSYSLAREVSLFLNFIYYIIVFLVATNFQRTL